MHEKELLGGRRSRPRARREVLQGAMALGLSGTALSAFLAACGGSGAGSGGSSPDPSKAKCVNVVKLQGVSWFSRMEVGVKKFAQDSHVNATQTGADDASPEKQ